MRGREVVFLLGVAGSGKTKRCIAALRGFEAEGKPALYLVPEQSTYIADRQILEPPGPEALRHVRVVSFRRIGFLLEEPGTDSRTRALDRSGRRILLRALFARLEPALQRPFAAVADRPGFLESLVSVLREIRDHAGPGGVPLIDELADRPDIPGDLRGKLATVAALRRSYAEALVARGLRDPDLLLIETPARILAHADEFRDRPVFVDGFLSFTRLETEVLAALAQTGARLTIGLCLDPGLADLANEIAPPPPQCRITEWPHGFAARAGRPVFLAPLRTFAEVRARIHAAGFHTRVEAIAGPPPRFRSPEIGRLESELLARRPVDGTGLPSQVELLAARDPSHEVEMWARRVDQWLRLDENPVRPGEVAIIVRDLETYRPLVEETFARYRIPVFVDRHWDISSRPIVRTILDCLEVLRTGWQREAVISFLRSPCLGCRGGEIDLIENLSLEAGYDFEKWTGSPWTPLRRPPRTRYTRGAGEDETPAEAATEEEATDPEPPIDRKTAETADRIEAVRTSIANRIRTAHLEPLKALEGRLSSGETTGREAVAALRDWMKNAGLGDHAAEPDGEREIEAIEHVCESIAVESEQEILTLDGFAQLVIAGLGSLKLGRTPTRPDTVILAEVQRSRLGEVRRAIVGGLTASDFPRAVVSDRYFNDRERAMLGQMGLDLGIPDSLRQEEEAYFLYIALTRASERLVLTRPTTGIEGGSLDPSPFLDEVRAAVPGLVERPPQIMENPAELGEAQTADELAARVGAYIASRLDRRVAGRDRMSNEERAQPDDRRILTVYNRLLTPLAGSPASIPAILDIAGRMWGYDNRPSLPASVVQLASGGRVHTASVGRLESFARCPYQHFARHMLRLTQRPRAEVTPLENGLLSHKALEILMQEGIPSRDRGAVDRRLREVFHRIEADPSLQAFAVTPGGRFRWDNTRSRLRRFLEVEALRLSGAEFRPFAFEREFGTSTTPPLRIPLADGSTLLLRGRIDRIDTAGSGSETEALVVDYKSGSLTNKGRPADLQRGHDLQLAVYLLVVREVFGLEPFGALYAPVLPKPASKRSSDPENPLDVRLIGLVPMAEVDRVTGGRELLRESRPPLKTHSELLALLEEARGTIALYAGALLRGRIDVAPVRIGGKAPCDSCDFKPLCRVDEMYNPFRSSPRDGFVEPEADR